MALDGCAPCNCIPTNISNEKFKQDIENILCSTLSVLEEFAGTAVSIMPQKVVAFGDITNAFVNQEFFTCGGPTFRYLRVQNNTNQPVGITFNTLAGVQFTIAAGDELILDYGVPVIMPSNNVYLKYTGAAPGSGSVVFEGAC